MIKGTRSPADNELYGKIRGMIYTKNIVTGILMGAIVALIPSNVLAYQCKSPVAFEEEIHRSSMIFIGQVKKIEKEEAGGEYPYKVTLDVAKIFKGLPQEEIDIYFNYVGGDFYGSCFKPIEPGESFLIYAQGEEKLITEISSRGVTHKCSRTMALDEAQEDILLLSDYFKVP